MITPIVLRPANAGRTKVVIIYQWFFYTAHEQNPVDIGFVLTEAEHRPHKSRILAQKKRVETLLVFLHITN